MQRIQQLQANAQQLERLRRIRQQELVLTERQALQPVLETLQTVLQRSSTSGMPPCSSTGPKWCMRLKAST